EHVVAPIKDTNTTGAIGLVSGEHIKIAAERLHVDRHTRHRLTPVNQYLRALRMGETDDLLDRQYRAGDIRDMGNRDEASARRELRLEFREVEPTGRVDPGKDKPSTDAPAQHLPGHDVGMVFELTDQYFVAGLKEGRTPALRHEVDRLGRTADE